MTNLISNKEFLENYNRDEYYSVADFFGNTTAPKKKLRKKIKDGVIIPDIRVGSTDDKADCYFKKSSIEKICNENSWYIITPDNMKDIFKIYCGQTLLSVSYKAVFTISFLTAMDKNGVAEISAVTANYESYYRDRIARGLKAEKTKGSVFTKGEFTTKDAQKHMIENPLLRHSEMKFITKDNDVLRLNKNIVKNLTDEDIKEIIDFSTRALHCYWNEI